MLAISNCVVDVDGMHAMTTELRAAYEQMDAVWKCLPSEFRLDEDGSWWANEAKDRLAAFNHPTSMSLALSLAEGGFADAEVPESYVRLAVWLGRLGCGYGLALGYLARVLRTEGDIDFPFDSGASRRALIALDESRRACERSVSLRALTNAVQGPTAGRLFVFCGVSRSVFVSLGARSPQLGGPDACGLSR